ALTCKYQQVVDELRTTKKLRISTGCESLGKEFSSSLSSGLDAASSAQTRLGAAAHTNSQEIWKCDNAAMATMGGGNSDVGPLRQSAQYLCASRLNLEAAFVSLSACEVLERTAASYLPVMGDQTQFQNEVKTQVADPVENACNSCGSISCGNSC